MELSPGLSRLLGLDRIQSFVAAYRENTAQDVARLHGTILICGAVLISAIPILGFNWFEGKQDVDLITFAVGFAACLSLLYRVRLGIRFPSVVNWKASLKHVHTAFALGCVPFVVIALFFPELLQAVAEHKDAVTASTGTSEKPSVVSMITFVLGVSVWAGLTEEVIYRGLLVSVLRRWKSIPKQSMRDLFAVVVSALIFGLGHLPLWGPGMSLALVGLGLGFGAAYIAVGEKLLPLIVYHILFDILSLSVSLFVL